MDGAIPILAESQPQSACRLGMRKLFFPKSHRQILVHRGEQLPYGSSPWVFDWFDAFALLVIIANTVTLALADPLYPNSQLAKSLEYCDLAFNIFFVLEVVVRLVSFGFVIYKADKWNIIDSAIVITGVLSAILQFSNITPFSLSALRSVRVLRPLRSLRLFRSARILVVAAISAITSLTDVTLLYILFLVLAGVGGVSQYNSRLRTRCVVEDYWNPNITSQYPQFGIMDYIHYQNYEQTIWAPVHNNLTQIFTNWSCMTNFTSLAVLSLLGPNITRWRSLTGCTNFTYDPTFNYTRPTHEMEMQWRSTIPPEKWEVEIWQQQTCDDTDAVVLKGYICPWGYRCVKIVNPFDGKFGFDSLPQALLTLFTSVTLELWYKVMYLTMDAVDPTSALYFIAVVIVGAFFIINLSIVLITVEFQHAAAIEREKEAEADSPIKVWFAAKYAAWIEGGTDSKKVTEQSGLTTMRQSFYKSLNSKYVNGVIYGIIIANVIMMTTEFYGMPDAAERTIDVLNLVFTILYTIELALRLFCTPAKKFLNSALSVLDVVIVVTSWVDYAIPSFRFPVVRAFRTLRLFKVFESFPTMYVWIRVIIRSLKSSFVLATMIGFCLFIFASLGMHLFGGFFCNLAEGASIYDPLPDNSVAHCPNRPRLNYDGIVDAMITSFVVMAGDDWDKVMITAMRARGDVFALYYVIFFLISNYVLLNLLIGILLSVRPADADEAPVEGEDEDEEEEEQAKKKKKSFVEKIEVKKKEKERVPDIILANGQRISALQPEEDDTLVAVEMEETNAALRRVTEAEEKIRKQMKQKTSRIMGVVSDETGEGPKFSGLQLKLQRFLTRNGTQYLIMVVILFSSINLALESPTKAPDTTSENIIRIIDFGLNLVFVVEVLLSFLAYGVILKPWCYLRRDSWNVIDFFLVVTAVAGEVLTRMKKGDNTAAPLRALRVVRAVRPLRFVKRAEGLRIVVSTLARSIRPLQNLVVVIFIILTLWGIMGVQLFKGSFYKCSDPQYVLEVNCTAAGHEWVNAEMHFDHIGAAYLSLFTIATIENWADIMFDGIDAVGPGHAPVVNNNRRYSLYFISFVIVGGVFFVNLFVSVIIDAYQKEKKASRSRSSRWLTPSQNAWVKTQHILISQIPLQDYDEQRRATGVGNCYVGFRRHVRKLVRHPLFDVFIYCCIVVNFLVMAIDQYPKPDVMTISIQISNTFFTSVFAVEAAMKIVCDGWKRYIASKWNRFDFIIVALSVLALFLEFTFASATFAAFFRTMRVLRLLRIIRKSRRLQAVLKKFLFALYSLNNVAAVVLLVFFIFGVMGIKLFGRIQHGDMITHNVNFENVISAMLLMLRIATGGDWPLFLQACSQQPPTCDKQIDGCGQPMLATAPFFILFLMVGMFILINLFVAVIMESFSVVADDVEYISDSDGVQFLKLWLHFDPERTYRMEAKYLLTFLRSIPPDCKLGMGVVPEKQRLRRELLFVDSLQLDECCGMIELQDLIGALCERAYGRAYTIDGRRKKKSEDLPPKRRIQLNKKTERRFRKEERDRHKPEIEPFNTVRRVAALIFEAYYLRHRWQLRRRQALAESRAIARANLKRRAVGTDKKSKKSEDAQSNFDEARVSDVLSDKRSEYLEQPLLPLKFGAKEIMDFAKLMQDSGPRTKPTSEAKDNQSLYVEEMSVYGGNPRIPETVSEGSSSHNSGWSSGQDPARLSTTMRPVLPPPAAQPSQVPPPRRPATQEEFDDLESIL